MLCSLIILLVSYMVKGLFVCAVCYLSIVPLCQVLNVFGHCVDWCSACGSFKSQFVCDGLEVATNQCLKNNIVWKWTAKEKVIF
jgi:hypothetical protein